MENNSANSSLSISSLLRFASDRMFIAYTDTGSMLSSFRCHLFQQTLYLLVISHLFSIAAVVSSRAPQFQLSCSTPIILKIAECVGLQLPLFRRYRLIRVGFGHTWNSVKLDGSQLVNHHFEEVLWSVGLTSMTLISDWVINPNQLLSHYYFVEHSMFNF